ncbi:MAG TPA: DUF1266 domain-containing protein [Candidatus Corynebacterium avicola]|uniref:DUF1266 domain-containing protein n=1 Tax=Candidatus Corynebacterium avicola TaxID=2838527 RepID=A0A9D1RP94_9CORY|nr:DUF1266 domain-containing protein [Candidatus Corynebacterium avicola]
MTLPADFAAPTYDERIRRTAPAASRPEFVWLDAYDPTLQRAWSLSLPHDLVDGRVVDGPAPEAPPNEGFRRMFAVDRGQDHRHRVASVYGVKDAATALEVAWDRLRLARTGNAHYRELLPLLQDIVSAPPDDRNPTRVWKTLTTVDTDKHDLVIPFLQDEAVYALPEDLPVDTVAWDVSVAMRILWLAHGGGLFEDTVACHDLARDALDLIRSTYSSWREVADGIVVGRALSTGRVDESCIAYVDQVALALNHPDSPWVRLPLHDVD